MAKNSKKKVGDKKASAPVPTESTEVSTTPLEGENGDEKGKAWKLIQVAGSSVTDEKLTCRMDGCEAAAVAIWKSKEAPVDDDTWPLCKSCQEKHIDGRADETKHCEVESKGGEEDEVVANTASSGKDGSQDDNDASTPAPEDTSSSNGNDEASDDDEEEAWDLTKIMSIAELNHEYPIKCQHEFCTLPAAVVYMSNGKPPEKWYSCLDCQETDYGGWPDDLDEFPVQHMTQEHKVALISKCSKNRDIAMPVFAESPSKGTHETADLSNTVTPPPNAGVCQQNKGTKVNGKSTITPSPADLEAVKQAGKKKAKPSKAQLELHRKWQEAAQALGGPDAKIVVNKPDAKKRIFELLYDAFAPMNITQIHKKLKAVVPSPVLKACLDDMALDTDASTQFADSDDEDESKEKSKQKEPSEDNPYKGSLSFKSGKGSNASLYYVNYSTAKNGDGLDREEKNKLSANLATAQADEAALKELLKKTTAETTKLLSEPTNEEATSQLEKEEAELLDLQDKLEAARKLKVNEKHKQQIKRRIDNMTTFWRKRRRICMDFMIAMEENTDGTISAKKCFAGDGQIELDSDEAVAKAALEFGKKKRSRPMLGGMKRPFTKSKPSNNSKAGIPPSETFVAVLLDAQGCVERVHLQDE